MPLRGGDGRRDRASDRPRVSGPQPGEGVHPLRHRPVPGPDVRDRRERDVRRATAHRRRSDWSLRHPSAGQAPHPRRACSAGRNRHDADGPCQHSDSTEACADLSCRCRFTVQRRTDLQCPCRNDLPLPSRQGVLAVQRSAHPHERTARTPQLECPNHDRNGYRRLVGRNLIGSLLPVAIPFLRGFAAEYPWGTVFGVTDDEEESSYGIAQDLPTPLVPAWSEIVCEWEYDSSRTNSTIHVPSRRLLDSDLRWNGLAHL